MEAKTTCSKPVHCAFVFVMSSDFAAPSFFLVAGKCEAGAKNTW